MTDAVQPSSPEAAQGRLAELSGNPEWSSKVLANDPTSFAEFQSLTTLIAGPPAPAAGTTEAMALETSRTNDTKMLNDYLATAGENGFPELTSAAGKDMVEMLNGKPVSQEIHDAVKTKLDAMLKDKDWVTRFENREQRAMREFQIATVILTADVVAKREGVAA
jgi:hypothetical protein